MKHNIYPIGSVVKVRGMEALVTGHTMAEEKGKMVLHYILVPFPLGYTDADCVRMAMEEELELLFAGYTDESSERYAEYWNGISTAAEHCTAEEFRRCWAEGMEELKKEAEA